MMDRISTLERVDLIPDDVRTRVFYSGYGFVCIIPYLYTRA